MRKFDLKKFFSSDRRILYVIFVSLLISVFSLTIGYAALSVTLNIQGNAEVVASTWDVYLDNAKVTSGSVSGTVPTITNKTTASFSTTLTEPGDFYEFSIDVVNSGTIDAMIESISKTPTLTESQSKYLKYIIEYQNGEAITTKQLVNAGSFVRLKVRIEYRSDISASDIPTTSETLNLKFTVNYTQGDGSGSSVADDGIKTIVVPEGGTFMQVINLDEEEYIEYNSGEKLPIDYSISMGDAYLFEDYVYMYSDYDDGETPAGWVVTGVTDKSKESYKDIPDYVFDKPVVWLSETFKDCTSLKVSPKLPSTLYAMTNTFENCDSLTDSGVPELPDGIVHISYIFMNCDNLVDLSNFYIPDSVINMFQTFDGCKSLKKAPKLPIHLECLDLTFANCTSLESSPIIPESVDSMWSTFSGCTSLSGNITINANPSNYPGAFSRVDMSKITLSGTSTIK